MRDAQRVIKYFALALAAVLILMIATGILSLVSLAGMATWNGDLGLGEPSVVWTEEAENAVRRLEISAEAASVRIVEVVEADQLVRVESTSEYIESWQDAQTLKVVEKAHTHWPWTERSEVTVYVRSGVEFEKVSLNVKAGTLNVEKLVAADLELELGAGKTHIGELRISQRTRIEGGAGVIEVRSGELKNLDLELGAGKAEIHAKVRGDGRIETGVGKLELELVGAEEDYKMTIDKGIGSVSLNRRALEDGGIYGKGENLLKIESGVGAVEITTVEE